MDHEEQRPGESNADRILRQVSFGANLFVFGRMPNAFEREALMRFETWSWRERQGWRIRYGWWRLCNWCALLWARAQIWVKS